MRIVFENVMKKKELAIEIVHTDANWKPGE